MPSDATLTIRVVPATTSRTRRRSRPRFVEPPPRLSDCETMTTKRPSSLTSPANVRGPPAPRVVHADQRVLTGGAVEAPGVLEVAVRVGDDEVRLLRRKRDPAAVAADPAGRAVRDAAARTVRDPLGGTGLPVEDVDVDSAVVLVACDEVRRERREEDVPPVVVQLRRERRAVRVTAAECPADALRGSGLAVVEVHVAREVAVGDEVVGERLEGDEAAVAADGRSGRAGIRFGAVARDADARRLSPSRGRGRRRRGVVPSRPRRGLVASDENAT